MEKNLKILLIIILAALILRILFIFSTPIRGWDETVYANLGYELSKNPFEYSFTHGGWSDRVPDGSWPKAGFRAPLLPYMAAMFYFLKLPIFIELISPIIGALTVFIVYLFGKRLFNEKAALYSSVFIALIPMHILYSSKVMTDALATFLIIASLFVFWGCFEEDNKKFKILFGFVFALAILARYTSLWLFPFFFVYLLIRKKIIGVLRNKYTWYSLGLFFLTLLPWFIYGAFEYGNPLGPFIHGSNAASYWGGIQPWDFFIMNYAKIFSIVGVISIYSVLYLVYKKEMKKEVYFLLLFALIFVFLASIMPHKEERIILPIIPIVALISGNFISSLKYRTSLTIIIIVILFLHIGGVFYGEYNQLNNQRNVCFVNGAKSLMNTQEDSLVITDQSTIAYYYLKKEIVTFPEPINWETFDSFLKTKKNRNIYVLLTDYQEPWNGYYSNLSSYLNSNLTKIYDCNNETLIYRYSALNE